MGVRQGCSFPPIVLLMYMDEIVFTSAYQLKKSPVHSAVIMDGIVKNSESCAWLKVGDCSVQRLLFADDLVLLDFTQIGLNKLLAGFQMHSLLSL